MNRGNVDSDGNREVTTRGVYVANKRNVANITHIYRVSSLNLITANLPYVLLPNTPVVGHAIYFGIDTSLTDSGPFNNLIFDIGTPAIYPTTAAILWEYWNGGAWAAIASITDSTSDTIGGTESWTIGGIGSIAWTEELSTTAVSGITGYWVRARVTNIGTGITSPTQQNRQIYSTVWPYIEIQEGEVVGDIPALEKIDIVCKGYEQGGGTTDVDKVIVSSRVVERGDNFTPCINLSQSQNPDDISITAGLNTSFVTDTTYSPTGESISYGPAVGAGGTFRINIASPLSIEYGGKFRAILRLSLDSGAPANSVYGFEMSYQVAKSSVITKTTSSVVTGSAADQLGLIIDFGVIDVGVLSDTPNDIEFLFTLSEDVSGSQTLYAESFWLMPADELIISTNHPSPSSSHGAFFDFDRKLAIDNISTLKKVLYILTDNSEFISLYASAANEKPNIINNKRLRIYFLFISKDSPKSSPDHLNLIKIQSSQRYLSMRGNQ